MKESDPNSLDLSILILTRNECVHIERCIRSAQQLGVHIYVIDSYSTDGTADLALAMGAQVVECCADRFADKFNWALSNIEFHTTWVMRLDADEILSAELVQALSEELRRVPANVSGILLRRQLWFMGQWMRRGGVYPTWTMRIWRRGLARCESRDLDEHMLLIQGQSMTLALDVIDNPLTDVSEWTEKHNRYATIEAMASRKINEAGLLQPRLFGSSVERIRWLKVNVFHRIPLFVRPIFYFIYRYIIRLGFLDGKKGFIFHFLHAFWYRVLVDAKIFEFKNR